MNHNIKLIGISIKELFGKFDYSIDIPGDYAPLILTGPNGYGKSTILNIIESASNRNLLYFHYLPFSHISLQYSDGSKLDIFGDSGNLTDSDCAGALIEDTDEFDIRVGELRLPVRKISETKQTIFRIETPFLKETVEFGLDNKKIEKAVRRIRYWRRLDIKTIDQSSDDYINFVLSNKVEIQDYLFSEMNNPVFLFSLESLPSACLIPAQRIFTKLGSAKDEIWKESIDVVSQDLRNRLINAQGQYLRESQIRNSDFIIKALNDQDIITEEEYNKKVSILLPKIKFLKDCGLISDITFPEFSDRHDGILHFFIEDLSYKLSIFDDTITKLKLFINLVSAKKFTNKTIEITVQGGLRFKSDDGYFVGLDKLSSGEKNEIIMLYNYIFKVGEGSILLIDEPEISLHVAWQLSFIDEIVDISSQNKLTTIVATHSPEIINERWDECVDLFEISNN